MFQVHGRRLAGALLALAASLLARSAYSAEAQRPMLLGEATRHLGRSLAESLSRQGGRLRVSVAPIYGEKEKLGHYLRDHLEQTLAGTSYVQLIERGRLDLLLAEHGIEKRLAADDTYQSIGNRLGAEVMIVGTVTDLGGTYSGACQRK